jgi:hypothetical protein
LRDKKDNCIIICSIENVDPMGTHTGDSVTVAPALTLTDKEFQIMRNASIACLRKIGVETGGSNVQFAINPKNGRMVVIEMNPRVSRSSALASKATGFPIAKVAAKLAIGYTLNELKNEITGSTPASFEPTIDYVVTKIPRFTFEKFKCLIYASYGNVIFNNFLNFNLYEAFRGLESVFYFPSSIRYFWPLNKFIFGETFFGFILISFLYPIVFFYIFKYLFGTMFSIILTAIVTLTRLFEGYALCVINMIQHINAGDAEPLAIFLLLSSLLIFLKITKGIIGFNSKFYSFLLGFLLFLSVSLRPNFFPTALIFILVFAFYIFKYHNNNYVMELTK